MNRVTAPALLALTSGWLAGPAAQARELSFEERVRAQEAIEDGLLEACLASGDIQPCGR